jgi:hypothetical protein
MWKCEKLLTSKHWSAHRAPKGKIALLHMGKIKVDPGAAKKGKAIFGLPFLHSRILKITIRCGRAAIGRPRVPQI